MYRRVFKRLFDILCCIAAAPFALLLLLPAVTAIAIEDGFPAFYNAPRIGRGHRPFVMYKLRSMKKNAPDLRLADGSTYSSAKDPRLTRVGAFLRKSSIDELPQLLNVFLGQMSIIGPRPDLPDEAERYTPFEEGRLSVLPGITGYSQAYYRNDISYAEKYRQDVYYAEHLSLAFDIRILLQTVRQVLGGKGVYTASEEVKPEGLLERRAEQSLLLVSCHAPSVMGFRLDMMKRFMTEGWTVGVLAPDPAKEWEPRFAAHGIAYRQISLDKNGTNPLRDLKSCAELVGLLRRLAPNALFCDHAKAVIYGSVAGRLCGIRNINVMIAGAGSVLRSEKGGLKSRLVRRLLMAEYRFSLGFARTVFFQNADDAALFTGSRLVNPKKIVFVPGSGVNLERFPKKPQPKDRRFLFVGRLIADKGLSELLTAAQQLHERHPACVFDIVGFFDSNPTAMRLEDIQPYIDSGAVCFHGYKENVLPYLENCFCFVLPSYHEGTPRAVLEAMAVGRAIITTDAPGCRETVEQNVNGLLVPVRNADALTEACDRLWNQPQTAVSMGEASRRLAEEKYDVVKVNEIILGCVQNGHKA